MLYLQGIDGRMAPGVASAEGAGGSLVLLCCVDEDSGSSSEFGDSTNWSPRLRSLHLRQRPMPRLARLLRRHLLPLFLDCTLWPEPPILPYPLAGGSIVGIHHGAQAVGHEAHVDLAIVNTLQIIFVSVLHPDGVHTGTLVLRLWLILWPESIAVVLALAI